MNVTDYPALPAHIAERGECTKPTWQEVEFSPDSAKHSGPAERVCRLCMVAGDCLAWAVSTPGVRGVYSGVLFHGQGAPARIIRPREGSRT